MRGINAERYSDDRETPLPHGHERDGTGLEDAGSTGLREPALE
jgi:hypothetical protein